MSVARELAELMSRHPRIDRMVVAEALRVLRRGSGLPADEFSLRAELPVVLLEHAESGKELPGRDVLLGYLQAANPPEPDRQAVRTIWEQARFGDPSPPSEVEALSQRTSGYRCTASVADTRLWPVPESITSVEEFVRAMEQIKKSSGMSYTALAEESRKRDFPVSRSALHALCTKTKLPRYPGPVFGLLTIAGATPELTERWLRTWQRLSMGGDAPAEAVEAAEAPVVVADESLAPRPVLITPRMAIAMFAAGLLMAVFAIILAFVSVGW